MAPRKKKYNVQLTDGEYLRIKELLDDDRLNNTLRTRCRILLSLDEGHGKTMTYEECLQSIPVSWATIAATARKYAQEGLDSVLSINRNANSDTGSLKIDEEMMEHLLHLVQGPPPEGKKRWTYVLLASEFDGNISRSSIHRVLQKANISLK